MVLVLLVEYGHGRVYALQTRDVEQLLEILHYCQHQLLGAALKAKGEREREERKRKEQES